MTTAERELLEERLIHSEAQLLELLEPVTGVQWFFRESDERWSLAENLEHLVLFEVFIRKVIVQILTEPASENRTASVDDMLVLELRDVGPTKLQSRPAAVPTGGLGGPDVLLRMFQRERAKTLDFARSASGDLRAHRFAHLLLGELDGYQWLLVIAQHTERHITQMKTVMAASGFPQ